MENKLRAAPIFTSSMVLQREKPITIWGAGQEDESICVTWKSDNHSISKNCVVQNGEWRVTFPPLEAGLSGSLIIKSGGQELCFFDIITGDVWFAGGQSNMELELQNCLNGKTELASCANNKIRFYNAVKRAFIDEVYLREEALHKWENCAPETTATLSAAAYFFARHINSETGIPVGIINCNWGGTSISAWMSEAQLARSKAGQRYLDDYAALIGNKTDAQYDAEMEDYFAKWRAWDKRVRDWLKKEPEATWETLNKKCGICPWPQPAGKKKPLPSN